MFSLPHHHTPPTLTGDPTLWQLYTGLQGRVGRRTFWLHGVIGLTVFSIVAMALLEIAGYRREEAAMVANLAIAWPLFAISAKRWHDWDCATWWGLVAVIPLVGRILVLLDGWWMPMASVTLLAQIVVLIFNGLLPGTRGANRYGPPPSR